MKTISLKISLAVALAASLGACGARYYPMVVNTPMAPLDEVTCAELASNLNAAIQVERDIARIATDTRSNSANRPNLYSTRKSDAHVAVETRIAGLNAAMAAKECPPA